MDPFIDEVINQNAANIHRGYNVNRNQDREAFAAAGGFGSTAQGVQGALTNEAEARQIGDMDAQLRSQGFSTAMNNAINLYRADQANNINLCTAYTNYDQYGRNVAATDQNRQLSAGDRIQAQNQAELDAYYRERDRELGYPYQQIDVLKSILGAFPSDGGTKTATEPGVGAVQGAIGGGMTGYMLQNAYGLPSWPTGQQVYSSPTAVGPHLPGEYGPWPAY